jgi:predicted fused transcriptional regulator/phosphomethylpyrimidine kinase
VFRDVFLSVEVVKYHKNIPNFAAKHFAALLLGIRNSKEDLTVIGNTSYKDIVAEALVIEYLICLIVERY